MFDRTAEQNAVGSVEVRKNGIKKYFTICTYFCFRILHISETEIQYSSPSKRKDPKESQEKVAHKVAWAAVEKKYKKDSDGKWVPI